MSSVNSNDSGDKLYGCDEGLGIDFIQKRFCFLDVGSLPVCQEKSHSLSRSIDYGVNFGDPEENPLSAPTVCHSDHTSAFTLSVKTEKNITGQAEVQASVPPPCPLCNFL
ncbi:hypothetical protein AAJCM20276_08320 [Acetobacter aceti]|uniref:Uncharacterized protein n=1 Tax=Acetobacter aceti TaxID=435 RepID=A0A6S6PEP1_ACEAC|nr:hypothetical protein AAJCM20276_08320 [Acetobacter aceti]